MALRTTHIGIHTLAFNEVPMGIGMVHTLAFKEVVLGIGMVQATVYQ